MSPLNGKAALIVGVANAPSIAFCPADDLHGRVTDCSRQGFARAMDILVPSPIRRARLAEPVMAKGGPLRALAVERGPKIIRVNAISPGPLQTRAGSGIAHFDAAIDAARRRAPGHALVTIADVGAVAVMLASDGASDGASRISGDITYADGGLHVRA
jgi:enoyl-[acyl-carrier protein] reductase I